MYALSAAEIPAEPSKN